MESQKSKNSSNRLLQQEPVAQKSMHYNTNRLLCKWFLWIWGLVGSSNARVPCSGHNGSPPATFKWVLVSLGKFVCCVWVICCAVVRSWFLYNSFSGTGKALRLGNLLCGRGFSMVPSVELEKRCVWGFFCAVVVSLWLLQWN